MQLIHSTPGKPRGRGKVERLFGTITTELLPTLPGHIPPGNHGRPVTPPALTLSQLDAAVGRVHRGHLPPAGAPGDRADPGAPVGGGGLAAPDARLAGSVGPAAADRGAPRGRCNATASTATGCGTSPSPWPPYVGEPVTIRYDPRDLAEIRVYHHDEFLCRAVSPDIAAATVSMQDLQAARNQRRRELRQQLTARRSLVELLTHPPSGTPEVAARRHSPPRPVDRGDPA